MTEITIDPEKKYTGKVAKWLNHKGIGFIAVDDFVAADPDAKDVIIVHENIIKAPEGNDGFKSLATNEVVEFKLIADPKDSDGSRYMATELTGPDGAAPLGRQRGRKGKGKGKGKGRGKGKGKGKRTADDEDEENKEEEE